jgi:uncharacterized protein YyaL (SSP411 family)
VSQQREAGIHRYSNRLAEQTSPYLLQHAHNPVDWYPWGTEALERARREDRPIFLSIGYAACHWCHVMERESFEDPKLAELLNREFVPIKVDREERPDIDEVYMAAVQAMTGSGGWPMSVFLTPDLEPFYGGTYFPPDDRHGLPGFGRVLAAVADAYRTRREEVVAQSQMLAAHLREQLTTPSGRSDVAPMQLEAAVRRLQATFDAVNGGFGAAPKFPAPMTLEFMLRAWRGSSDASVLGMVTGTLDAMAGGGIHDQLGGGFARYSTDAAWLVPHFEKMLYDNAQLAHCYLEAFRGTGEPRYRAVVESTLDFVLRELSTPDGGFASGLDADSEGEEGRFYVWTDAEFRDALAAAGLSADEIGSVAAYWDVTPEGNWEGRSILHVAGPAADAGLVERGRAVLFAARERRVRPARDDKQLAAWNGLLLRALAEAGGALRREDYLAAATRLTQFIAQVLVRPEGGVWRTARDGQAHTPGFLEDHAFLADGLLAAHAATGAPDDLILARKLIDRAIAEFWDDEASLFWDTSAEHEAIVARPRSVVDGATPSGNSVAAEVLLRLALLTGEPDYDRRARAILRHVAGALDRQPSAFGRMLAVADRALAEQVDVVIAADLGDAAAQELRNVALAVYAPDLVMASFAPGAPYREWPLFESKSPRSGRATAYVCRGYACEAPTSESVDMARQIALLAQPGSASAGKEREPNLPR